MAETTPRRYAPQRAGAAPSSDGYGSELAIITESVECGGTERVVQALATRFPAAPIVANHFTGWTPDPDATPWAIGAQLLPSGRRKRHFLAPLYGRRLATAAVGRARVVLSLATGGWSLAAPIPPGARLACYCTGPPPALYGEASLYLRSEAAPLRPAMLATLPALRAYNRRLMRRPNRLITVSRGSAAAITRVYGRAADVVHPPVRTDFFTPAAAPKRHFLAVARLVPQKQLDHLVDAFRHLDATLVVAGRGPWLERLRSRAPSNVRLAGWVDDRTLRDLYRASHAVVCPSVEEFGIVMAEAHACGVPVVAPRAGGACEIVDDPATGVLLERVDAASVTDALGSFGKHHFDPDACRASAERFGEDRFVSGMEQIISEELGATRAPLG